MNRKELIAIRLPPHDFGKAAELGGIDLAIFREATPYLIASGHIVLHRDGSIGFTEKGIDLMYELMAS